MKIFEKYSENASPKWVNKKMVPSESASQELSNEWLRQ
jgi:hypothetical protein